MSKAPMPRAIEPTAIYSVKECAYLTATHPDTFRKKLQRRIVKGSRLLGDWRVRGSELLRLAQFPMNTPTESQPRAAGEAAHKDRPTEFQQAILLEVFRLALSTPREIADVFVEFSAHVGQIGVRVYPQGWQRDLDSNAADTPRTIPELYVNVGDDRPEAVAYVPEFLTNVQAAIAACRPATAAA